MSGNVTIDTNVKFRIAESVKAIAGDVDLCERGALNSASESYKYDLLGTLRVNLEVAKSHLETVTAEIADLEARAMRFLD